MCPYQKFPFAYPFESDKIGMLVGFLCLLGLVNHTSKFRQFEYYNFQKY